MSNGSACWSDVDCSSGGSEEAHTIGDPETALQPLWQLLAERGIHASATAAAPDTRSDISPVAAAVIDTDEEDQEDVCSPTLVGSLSEDAEDDIECAYTTNDEQLCLLTSSPGEPAVSLPKYTQWMPRPLPDPHSASLTELMEALIEIVSIEGPVICRRCYALYNRAAGNSRLGKQIVDVMNRAVYRAVKLGLLQQNDEQRRGGPVNQIVRLAGTPAVLVRERGARTLEEVPPPEIAAVRALIAKDDPSLDDDALLRRLAAVYGVGRVTSQIRRLLLA